MVPTVTVRGVAPGPADDAHRAWWRCYRPVVVEAEAVDRDRLVAEVQGGRCGVEDQGGPPVDRDGPARLGAEAVFVADGQGAGVDGDRAGQWPVAAPVSLSPDRIRVPARSLRAAAALEASMVPERRADHPTRNSLRACRAAVERAAWSAETGRRFVPPPTRPGPAGRPRADRLEGERPVDRRAVFEQQGIDGAVGRQRVRAAGQPYDAAGVDVGVVGVTAAEQVTKKARRPRRQRR